jgi:hypothetical protein
MNWDDIQGVLRAVIAFGGGYMVAHGYFDNQTVNDVGGAIITLGAAAWSLYHKRQLKAP